MSDKNKKRNDNYKNKNINKEIASEKKVSSEDILRLKEHFDKKYGKI